ncbi:MAG: cobyric acid synthase [Actinomycetota bacterium]|nr:cobyric acid synthase [Actinomycetota bacterium]
MNGSLLVCGTSSDAGKSVVVAGLCRFLRDRGVRVAPFKAQNMSLNSAVTTAGEEIGRAQAAQAFAAGVEPEAAMNPILIKPMTERDAQVVVMGRPAATSDALGYGDRVPELEEVVLDAYGSLRARFDVVVCEGAGSLAEFNLRDRDLVNLGFARSTDTPVVVVADIDRGGSFATLFGSLALLDPGDQALVGGFLLNKSRGDPRLLDEGLARFSRLTGRPFYGVLPWIRGVAVDAEDALAVRSSDGTGFGGGRPLSVAVVRLPSMSNFTDFDPLLLEPRVAVRFTTAPAEVAEADLVVLPGSKSTVADLRALRGWGLDEALAARARAGRPILGICGGFQMLGRHIVDEVESRAGEAAGLGLLPVVTEFGSDKVLARRVGRAPGFDMPVEGYEIRHGRPRVLAGDALFESGDGPEGSVDGAVCGTSWHGIFEADGFRRAFLAAVAERARVDWEPGDFSFAEVREEQSRRLGGLIAAHADTDGLLGLIENGARPDLPVVAPAGVP